MMNYDLFYFIFYLLYSYYSYIIKDWEEKQLNW